MVDIKTPAYPGSTGETLSDGFVVQMRTRDDVGRVLTLGLTPFLRPLDVRSLTGEGDGAMRLRVFTAALLRWDLPDSMNDAALEASLVSAAMAHG